MVFLIFYGLMLLLSIFTISWRISLVALGLQAVSVFFYVFFETEPAHLHEFLLFELLVLKGFLSPVFCGRQFYRAKIPRFIDLIPSNLLHWMVASFFMAFSFVIAFELNPSDFKQIAQVGLSLCALSLGILTLSSHNHFPGQVIALLTIENGLTLFTIGSCYEAPLFLEIFLACDFVFLVLLIGNFLRKRLPVEILEMKKERSMDLGDVL